MTKRSLDTSRKKSELRDALVQLQQRLDRLFDSTNENILPEVDLFFQAGVIIGGRELGEVETSSPPIQTGSENCSEQPPDDDKLYQILSQLSDFAGDAVDLVDEVIENPEMSLMVLSAAQYAIKNYQGISFNKGLMLLSALENEASLCSRQCREDGHNPKHFDDIVGSCNVTVEFLISKLDKSEAPYYAFLPGLILLFLGTEAPTFNAVQRSFTDNITRLLREENTADYNSEHGGEDDRWHMSFDIIADLSHFAEALTGDVYAQDGGCKIDSPIKALLVDALQHMVRFIANADDPGNAALFACGVYISCQNTFIAETAKDVYLKLVDQLCDDGQCQLALTVLKDSQEYLQEEESSLLIAIRDKMNTLESMPTEEPRQEFIRRTTQKGPSLH